MDQGISILIASSGRSSLGATLESARNQLRPGDELIVDVNDDAPWGHAARNRMMPRARGAWLMFIDDDDIYMPGALDRVRGYLSTDLAVHVFRMVYPNGHLLWDTATMEIGHISTQMFVVPNRPDLLGTWGDRYEGDFDFITETVSMTPDIAWHHEVIVGYGHLPGEGHP
jgi:glycosyltransferase involved in cell wall biosynthesis